MQRRFAWPLHKDDTHKSRSVNNVYVTCKTPLEESTCGDISLQNTKSVYFGTGLLPGGCVLEYGIVYYVMLHYIISLYYRYICIHTMSCHYSIIYYVMSLYVMYVYVYIYIYIYIYIHMYILLVYTYVYVLSYHIPASRKSPPSHPPERRQEIIQYNRL